MMDLHILRVFERVNLRSSFRTISFLSNRSKLAQQSKPLEDEEPTVATHETEHADDIHAIRDKSGLSTYLKSVVKGEHLDVKFNYDFKINNLRRRYGKYGEKSRLNPGLCYPTPEELAFKHEYENLAYPPLDEVLAKVRNKQAKETTYIKEREAHIEKNIKILPKLRKEMLERQARKTAEEKERIAKKEGVIAEIRDILGFKVDINDPRFQEMLEKRDLEEKKKKKLAKKEKQKAMALKELVGSSGVDLVKEKKDDEVDEDDEDQKPKFKK